MVNSNCVLFSDSLNNIEQLIDDFKELGVRNYLQSHIQVCDECKSKSPSELAFELYRELFSRMNFTGPEIELLYILSEEI